MNNYKDWLRKKIERSVLSFNDWKKILNDNKEGLKILIELKGGKKDNE